jgi:hypothetical protein
MTQITITLDSVTLARLKDYARDEAGTLPDVAAAEILRDFFSTDEELDAEPAYYTAAHVAAMYGLATPSVRNYIRLHPELVESQDFAKIDARTWGVKPGAAARIWGKKT